MMSGRSLGHTGGTLDKLESIPGYRTGLTQQEFASIIGECGFAMTGQSREVVPADRKLYALRDVTGTVESIPLITASIMSKKFAEGADALVFDVKAGAGAFMKTPADARRLAESLVGTGRSLGKKIVALITRMETPLGAKVGNFLEVEESAALLGVREALDAVAAGPLCDELMEVTYRLGAWMLVAAGVAKDAAEGESRCREAVADGSAARRFIRNIELQGGDPRAMFDAFGTLRAPLTTTVNASSEGTIAAMDAYNVGMAAVYLGAGRSKADDAVYPDVGIELYAKPGSRVRAGEPVARLWAHDQAALVQAVASFEDAVQFGAHTSAGPMVVEELTAL